MRKKKNLRFLLNSCWDKNKSRFQFEKTNLSCKLKIIAQETFDMSKKKYFSKQISIINFWQALCVPNMQKLCPEFSEKIQNKMFNFRGKTVIFWIFFSFSEISESKTEQKRTKSLQKWAWKRKYTGQILF